MRLAIATALAVGVATAPTVGAAVALQPAALVLHTADVPAGFVLDREATGIRTNAEEAGSDRKSRALIAHLGRITGYESEWHRGAERDSIVSRADVFRTRGGARQYVGLADDSLRAAGIQGLRRSTLGLGDQALVFHGARTGEIAWVVWRSGRVAGTVIGWGVRPDVTLALARAQQRRIVAATG